MEDNRLLNQVILQFQGDTPQLREDLSAVHLSDDGYLWLGCDEGANLERLTLLNPETKDLFGNHKRFLVQNFVDLPANDETEVDIEGLAESDNYLWLVGSHSWKRKAPKSDKSTAKNIERLATIEAEANRYLLARIPIIDGELYQSHPDPKNPEKMLTAAKLEATRDGNLLTRALEDDPHLGGFVKSQLPSKDNGFDIEGLAVLHDRIFLGLRGPVLRGWAIILELQVEDSSNGLLKLKKIGDEGRRYKKLFVNLQGLGVRELSIEGDDLIILAGPTMSLDGPVKLFRLENGIHIGDNTLSKPKVMMDIPYGDGVDHAEGITQFTAMSGKPSLLVVYDSPDPKRLVGTHEILADVFEF